MLINLHSQATTTPKVRAEIQASDEPAWVLAERYGTTEQTVWKWRKRDSVNDRSHTAHRLQTTLTLWGALQYGPFRRATKFATNQRPSTGFEPPPVST